MLSRAYPQIYLASVYLANSGVPTHSSQSNWQKVGGGGGTPTWTAEYDVRPPGIAAQANAASGRIDIKKTGIYLVSQSVSFNSIATGTKVYICPYKNGTLQTWVADALPGSTNDLYFTASAPVSLVAGDYLESFAWQSDSVSEGYAVGSQYNNRLCTQYLGPAS